MTDRTVAALIPAYQACRSVGAVVRDTLKVIPETLVVDDGSNDDTSGAAAAAGARVLRHERNLGKGRALLDGFNDLFGLGFVAVVTLDADGQHLAQEIPRLIEGARDGADLVIGCRQREFGDMSAVRRTSNRCSSYLISTVAGQPLPDVQSGFRLYTKRLIEFTGFPEPRFEAESAVVVRTVRCGFHVRSVPIRLGHADGRGTSHYRPIVDSLRIAAAVTRARLETLGWAHERS